MQLQIPLLKGCDFQTLRQLHAQRRADWQINNLIDEISHHRKHLEKISDPPDEVIESLIIKIHLEQSVIHQQLCTHYFQNNIFKIAPACIKPHAERGIPRRNEHYLFALVDFTHQIIQSLSWDVFPFIDAQAVDATINASTLYPLWKSEVAPGLPSQFIPSVMGHDRITQAKTFNSYFQYIEGTAQRPQHYSQELNAQISEVIHSMRDRLSRYSPSPCREEWVMAKYITQPIPDILRQYAKKMARTVRGENGKSLRLEAAILHET